jgi:hypothetical protein
MFEDTKWVIRSRKSKRDNHHKYDQQKKDERTNNDLQNITQKSKDRATLTPFKLGLNQGAPEGWPEQRLFLDSVH